MRKPIELASLVDTHDRPFVIIDSDFRVVAVNSAFEQAYRVDRHRVVGRRCYEVSHGNHRPCYELGEDCPHQQVFNGERLHTCLHTHLDGDGRVHHVQLEVHRLKGEDGELYLAEALNEISVEYSRGDAVSRMVGKAPAFRAALNQLTLAAQSHVPVLLQGETGTGKELAAGFIHEHSSRKGKPFVTIDCTVLQGELFESEVFGHERGAYTGSVGEKPGLFELADGGTVFLDEIGELSEALQAKMLRVLDTGEYRRVGGRTTRRTDARILCATNRQLRDVPWFRTDLYYRVACFSVSLPPLRERREDIPELAGVLLDGITKSNRRRYEMTSAAVDLLGQYDYPGNIRELRNLLWDAAVRAPDGLIDAPQLAVAVSRTTQGAPSAESPVSAALARPGVPTASTRLSDLEAGHIAQLLEEHRGSRRKVAAALGVSERTLYRKLKRHRLG